MRDLIKVASIWGLPHGDHPHAVALRGNDREAMSIRRSHQVTQIATLGRDGGFRHHPQVEPKP